MSEYDYRGRRVTDPKPVVRADTFATGIRELDSAWADMNKAKTALRRTEFNLREAELRPLAEESLRSSVPVDRVPKFSVDRYHSSQEIIVDKYGRTQYMKSKMSEPTRKVARLDDKYTEETGHTSNPTDRRNRSPLREPNQFPVAERQVSRRSRDPSDSDQAHKKPRSDYDPPYSELLESYRAKYKALDMEYPGVPSAERPNTSQESSRDITSSTAVRETDRNFLNDFSIRNDRNLFPKSKLTRVDVPIPSAKHRMKGYPSQGEHGDIRSGDTRCDTRGDTRGDMRGDTRGDMRGDTRGAGIQRQDVIPSDSTESHDTYTLGTGSGGSGSVASDTSSISRRFKKMKVFQSMEKEEGMAKVREMIRKQRLDRETMNSDAVKPMDTAPEIPDRAPNTDHDLPRPELPKRVPLSEADLAKRALHTEEEPITSKHYHEYQTEAPALPVRKVATAGRVPSYKGFSETQEGKTVKFSEPLRRRKKPAAPPPPEPTLQTVSDGGGVIQTTGPPLPKREARKSVPDSREPRKDDLKKMTRIMAPKKPARSEVITTHSWRKGQQAILKELGPHKMPKMSLSPPTKDRAEPDVVEEAERPVPPGEKKAPSLSSAQLSAEARSVLADLHSDQSDGEGERPVRGQTEGGAVTRDRSRSSSQPRPKRKKTPEKEQKDDKRVKHYNRSEVRHFMMRKKKMEKRQKQEEEEQRRKHEELKNKQLEELYKKQKETVKPHKAKPLAPPGEADEQAEGALADDRSKSSGESDKENQRARGRLHRSGDDFLSSSGSSTLTETGLEYDKPPALKPRQEPEGKSRPPKPLPKRPDLQDSETDLLLRKYLSGCGPNEARPEPHRSRDPSKPLTVDDIVRNVTQTQGVSINDIVSRYTQRAANIGNTYSGREPLPAPAIIPRGHDPGLREAQLQSTRGDPGSRFDRIQAIKNTSTVLQTRIELESQWITSKGVSGMPPDKWAQPRHEDPAYESRYHRMTGVSDDYRVFDQDLPGVQSLGAVSYKHQDQQKQSAAATKIQAAFRGHNVRQSLTWRVPEHKTVGLIHSKDSLRSDSDALSDSTLTEDSVSEDFFDSKKPSSYVPMPTDAPIKPSKPVRTWGEPPKADPYTFFSVYQRKQKAAEQAKLQAAYRNYQSDDDPEMEELTRPPPPRSYPSRHHASDLDSQRSRSQRSRSQRGPSPGSGDSEKSASSLSEESIKEDYADDFTAASASYKSGGRSSRSKSAQSPRGRIEGRSQDQDDSLDRTLTEHSISTNDSQLSEEPADRQALVLSRKSDTKSDRDSDWSDVSSLTDESDPKDKYKPAYLAPGYLGNRYSPGALDHRMAVELNLLDGMEESLRQLTDVERSRATAMSQQETVSFAQLLKAQQQAQMREMVELGTRAAQEKVSAARQLSEVQKHVADSANTISLLRTENAASVGEATRRLIETNTEAAKATAQAARHLAEIRGPEFHKDFVRETASAAATSAVQAVLQHYPHQYNRQMLQDHGTQYSSPSDPSQYVITEGSSGDSTSRSYSQSYDTYSKTSKTEASYKTRTVSVSSEVKTAEDLSQASAASIKSGSISTASDLSPPEGRKSPASSIHTESGLKEDDLSKTESVPEEIGSEKDYSADFDLDEDLDRSLREVLPSEGQRKKLKRQTSREEIGYMSSEDMPQVSSRRLSFEEDSFTRFTVDMVRQYMRDEETRGKHQNALLKLREKALLEKTKAELEWIEQQKTRLGNKGADDHFPQHLKQKQRGIIRRLKQEQAEIKRLQEAQKTASKERQLLLKQSEEIAKLRKSTHQVRERLKKKGEPSVSRPGAMLALANLSVSTVTSDVTTEDELSMHVDDASETSQPSSPVKEKSDSELHDSFHKLKLMKLDTKYLTRREKKLQQRRERAEEMIAWKRRLDEEESRISQIEREVENLEKIKRDKKREEQERDRSYEMIEGADTLQLTTPRTPRTENESSIRESIYSEKPDTARTSTSVISEKADTARSSKSGYSSIAEEITTEAPSTVRSKSHAHTTSDTSIAEEERTADDSEIHSSANDEYTNDTFEATEQTQTSLSRRSAAPSSSSRHQKNRLPKIAKENGFSIKSLQMLPNNNNIRKTSESESEDSFSVPASEAGSDIEERIRTLSTELKQRKLEAERLKNKQQRQMKDKLKQKEELLKEQIQNYDSYIDRVKGELNRSPEVSEHLGSPVRPQIKPPRERGAPKPAERATSVDRPRPELDASGKTTLTVSFEENKERISPREDSKRSASKSDVKRDPTSAVRTSEISEVKSVSQGQLPSETEISEDIAEEIPSGTLTETEKSELRLQLDDDEDKEREEKVPAITPRSARESKPDSARDSRLDSARSIPEIPEEYTESIQTARSETTDNEESSPRMVLGKEDKDVPLSARSEATPRSETAKSVVSESAKSVVSESMRSESHDDYSGASSASKQSDRTSTKSYSSRSKSDQSKSYSDDYSQDSSSVTVSTKSQRSKAKPVISEESEPKPAKTKSEDAEDLHTQDDISEAFSEVQSEIAEDSESKSSEPLFDLQSTKPVTQEVTDPLEGYRLGDRVLVLGDKPGTLRYTGFTSFATGCFAGVELDQALGVNDGTVDNHEYFKCPTKFGIFVQPQEIRHLSAEEDRELREKMAAEQDEPVEIESASQVSLDREMERIISSASEAVEDFAVETPEVTQIIIKDAPKELDEEDVEEISTIDKPENLVPSSDDDDSEEIKPKSLIEEIQEAEQLEKMDREKDVKPDKFSKASELAVQNLLNEAISQMITIRSRKRDSTEQTEPPVVPPRRQKEEPVLPPRREQEEPVLPPREEPMLPSVEQQEDDEEIIRPSAALGHHPDMTVDDLYDFSDDADDPWNDDDLGFGSISKSSHKSDSGIPSELKLDLNKLSEEAFYAIPRKSDEVLSLVTSAVDIFWERRRYGEPWDHVDPPSTYYCAEDRIADMESRHRKTYKKLVFDLTAQVLRDMYKDEEVESEPPIWAKRRLPRKKYLKHRIPPTTLDALKPLVEVHVSQIMGLKTADQDREKRSKWGARKKKDRVDQILVQELREDEPQWVNYDDDELAVKNQLTENLFESLLADTAKSLTPALTRWAQNTS